MPAGRAFRGARTTLYAEAQRRPLEALGSSPEAALVHEPVNALRGFPCDANDV